MRRPATLAHGYLAALLIFLLAIAGPRTRTDVGAGFTLFVLTTVQIALVDDSIREDAPGVAALHPVLVLLVLGLAAWIAWRTLAGRPPGRPAAPAATAGP